MLLKVVRLEKKNAVRPKILDFCDGEGENAFFYNRNSICSVFLAKQLDVLHPIIESLINPSNLPSYFTEFYSQVTSFS